MSIKQREADAREECRLNNAKQTLEKEMRMLCVSCVSLVVAVYLFLHLMEDFVGFSIFEMFLKKNSNQNWWKKNVPVAGQVIHGDRIPSLPIRDSHCSSRRNLVFWIFEIFKFDDRQ